MAVRWSAAVLAGLLLAGCLTVGPEADVRTGGTVDVHGPLRALLEGVPCEPTAVDPAATSDNLVTFTTLGYEVADHGEMDLRGDLLIHSTYGAGGFDLVNVSDPGAPLHLATFTGERGTSFDVKLHWDGTTVFQGVLEGVEIVDVSDPTEPVKTGEWLFPTPAPLTSAHMMYLYPMGNQTFLFIAPSDNSGVRLLEVVGTPGAYELHPLGSVAASINGPLGPHDMWATFDERLEAHVLYIANGFLGWLAYDITEPSRPKLLGGSPNLDTHQGYIHTIQSAWIGERRLVVTVSEVGVNAMRVFDATDLTVPVLVGSWSYELPAALQHNLQIVNGTLAFSHYGLGVYLFDLHAVGTVPYGQMLQLEPVGHFDVTASTWDVVVQDGVLYVGDAAELHVVGYGCWTPGDRTLRSTG